MLTTTANTDPATERTDANAAHLSVIIPVYAAEAESVILLRNALDHLRASSYQDFEILVADDASPRGEAVEAAAQEAGARLVRLDHRSLGPARARNAAAKNASGDIPDFPYGCGILPRIPIHWDASRSAYSMELPSWMRPWVHMIDRPLHRG